MCGRFSVYTKGEVLAERFHAGLPPEGLASNYNAAPSQKLPVILDDNPEQIVMAKWGFLPAWAKKNPQVKPQINARAETLESKTFFRDAYLHRRCLVLSDGFYEWYREGGKKIPYFIALKRNRPFAFAGLWGEYKGEPRFTIVTTEANSVVEKIHNRMPVILKEEDEQEWLGHDMNADLFFKPYPSKMLNIYRVTDKVNSTRFNSAEAIAPA